MFETFPELFGQVVTTFKAYNRQHDEKSRRLNSVERKLFNAMFFIETAERYPRSETNHHADNDKEMRAMDAYTDAAMAALHGALDMMASAISIAYGLNNRRGHPYSFAQMFDESGSLGSTIANQVGADAEKVLNELMSMARDLIDENNGSKHAGMSDVFLWPDKYPDPLKELSSAMMPALNFGKDIRKWLCELRARTDDIGRKICDAVRKVFPSASEKKPL